MNNNEQETISMNKVSVDYCVISCHCYWFENILTFEVKKTHGTETYLLHWI